MHYRCKVQYSSALFVTTISHDCYVFTIILVSKYVQGASTLLIILKQQFPPLLLIYVCVCIDQHSNYNFLNRIYMPVQEYVYNFHVWQRISKIILSLQVQYIGGADVEKDVKGILGCIFSRQLVTEVSRTGRGTSKAAFTIEYVDNVRATFFIKLFSRKEPYFNIPVRSCMLNIFRVSKLSVCSISIS